MVVARGRWCSKPSATWAVAKASAAFTPRTGKAKVLKEVDSNIPGYAKIRVRDVIFQPGASTPKMTMQNDMVCETTEGSLEVTKDGQTFTAP